MNLVSIFKHNFSLFTKYTAFNPSSNRYLGNNLFHFSFLGTSVALLVTTNKASHGVKYLCQELEYIFNFYKFFC